MREYKLGDIAFERKETVKGDKETYPIVGLEHLIPEQVILTEWDQASENTFTKMFRAGDVLFGRRRAYLKKAAVAPFDGICSGDITVIAAKEDVLSPRLLPFIIQNDMLFDCAVKMSAGGLSPRVKWQNLKDFVVVLPDLEKQEELAEILWSMEYTKRAYRNMIAQTDELVKSQFIELFGIEAKSFGAHLCDYASVFGGYAFKSKEFLNEGVPIIRISNIDGETVSADKAVCYPQSFWENNQSYRVIFNDVLMAMSGATIGKIGMVTLDIPLLLNQRVACIRAKQPEYAYFLATILKMPWMQDIINNSSPGSAQPNISGKQIEQLPIPAATDRQIKQLSRLAAQSDKSKFELQKALDELTAMQKKLMLNTFSEQ